MQFLRVKYKLGNEIVSFRLLIISEQYYLTLVFEHKVFLRNQFSRVLMFGVPKLSPSLILEYRFVFIFAKNDVTTIDMLINE